MLKALAYEKRREPKDVYDLVYVMQFAVETSETDGIGGPGKLAQLIRDEEARQDSFAHAVDSLQRHFSSPAENGPIKYAGFVQNTTANIQAYATVQEFLRNIPSDLMDDELEVSR